MVANEGTVGKMSELIDTSFSLAISIITTLNNGCIHVMHKLDYWQKMLRLAIEEIAVTKYSSHIDILSIMLKELKSHLLTYTEDIAEFSNYFKEQSRHDNHSGYDSEDEVTEVVVEPTVSPTNLPEAATVSPTNPPEAENGSPAPAAVSRRTSIITPAIKMKNLIIVNSSVNALDVLASTKELLSETPYTKHSLEYSKLNVAGRYDMIKFFGGDNIRDICNLLIGGRKAQNRGVLCWIDSITDMQASIDDTNERYRMLLDEKRNFWSFIMGIVAIATFPFAVMTGYFGMNFHNMNSKLFLYMRIYLIYVYLFILLL